MGCRGSSCMSEVKMKPNLTVKQRRFLKAYLAGASLPDAAKYAGSRAKSRGSLHVIGSRMLRSVLPMMAELLDAHGLTDSAMVEPLRGGINATRPIVATWEGKISDRIDVEDWSARHKFLELYHKLRGNLKDRAEITGRDGGDLILEIRPASAQGSNREVEF